MVASKVVSLTNLHQKTKINSRAKVVTSIATIEGANKGTNGVSWV